MAKKKHEPVDGPIKWPGGKAYLAKEIIALMPPRCKTPNAPKPSDKGWLHYVEPFFGGGRVLLEQDPEGISEVVSDMHADLTNFWRVLADTDQFAIFQRRIQAMPFSQVEWVASTQSSREKWEVNAAIRFFVMCRQSISGRQDSFAPLTRNRVRRGMNEQVSAWLSAVEGLPEVHERLMRVVILRETANKVSMQQNGLRTLEYLDPPYFHDTRVTTTEYGDHEMNYADHVELLALRAKKFGKVDWDRYEHEGGERSVAGQLLKFDYQSRFLLSGYHSDLYDSFAEANGWRFVEFEIANHASSSKSKKRMCEVVWMNY